MTLALRVTGAPFALYKGDSKDTLLAFTDEYAGPLIDMAFIDGGHSIETIDSDWSLVLKVMNPKGFVVFDDYYVGGPIDTTKYGCNELVSELPHVLLPDKDPVVQGGLVQMALVEIRHLR